MTSRAEQLIACLEAEIVKRDVLISGLEMAARFWLVDRDAMHAELAALKAKPSAGAVPDSAVEALKFYADGDHFLLADPDAWDTCSGEPMNFQHDEAGTASVEDGSIAKAALARLNPCNAQSVQVQICKLGRLGAAYDGPQTSYAYTYTDQPDNVGAMKLGRAAAINATRNHGDEIDRGLHLLLQLQAEGFGVFQIAANHTEQHLDMVPGDRQKESE